MGTRPMDPLSLFVELFRVWPSIFWWVFVGNCMILSHFIIFELVMKATSAGPPMIYCFNAMVSDSDVPFNPSARRLPASDLHLPR